MESERDSGEADVIARQLIDALRDEQRSATRGLLTSDEAARLLRADAEWATAHRVALGTMRLGDGPKARLRSPRELIDAYLTGARVGAPGWVDTAEVPLSNAEPRVSKLALARVEERDIFAGAVDRESVTEGMRSVYPHQSGEWQESEDPSSP